MELTIDDKRQAKSKAEMILYKFGSSFDRLTNEQQLYISKKASFMIQEVESFNVVFKYKETEWIRQKVYNGLFWTEVRDSLTLILMT